MIEEQGRQIKAASLPLPSLWFSSTLSLVKSRYVGAYEAGASAPGWDMAALKSSWFPTPDELSRLAQAQEEAK